MKRDNPTALYIFVTSDTPDLYINIIGYCIEHYKIIKVVFLGIVEDRGQKERMKNSLSKIKERVGAQLSLIQQGQYLYRDQDTGKWQQKYLEIESYDKLRYSKIAEQDIDIHVIIYETLDEELSSFLRSQSCIFDASGVLKTFLIDVYTLLLTKNVEDIYVFELRLPRRTFDERELIHNLSFDSRDYEYVNVTKSRYTAGTIIKTKSQENMDRSKIDSVNNLLETIADRFARNVLIMYAAIVLAIFVWASIFVIQGHWNELEPWTFLILALLPYLINIIALVFFKKEPSLRPNLLYDWLRNYKLRSLNDSLDHAEK
jgi:hypothetical protein